MGLHISFWQSFHVVGHQARGWMLVHFWSKCDLGKTCLQLDGLTHPLSSVLADLKHALACALYGMRAIQYSHCVQSSISRFDQPLRPRHSCAQAREKTVVHLGTTTATPLRDSRFAMAKTSHNRLRNDESFCRALSLPKGKVPSYQHIFPRGSRPLRNKDFQDVSAGDGNAGIRCRLIHDLLRASTCK